MSCEPHPCPPLSKQGVFIFTFHQEVFAISLIASVGLFFLCNKLIYNHPLGIHSIQVVEETSLLCLWATHQLRLTLNVSPQSLKYIGIVGFVALLLVSLHKNTYSGIKFLQKNYNGILPAIQALHKQPNQVIAVSHQFVAQAIEPSVGNEKLFFKAETNQDLVQLGQTLIEQGQQKFTYICYPYRPCQPPEDAPSVRSFSQENKQFRIELSKLGEFGKYPIYNGLIREQSSN